MRTFGLSFMDAQFISKCGREIKAKTANRGVPGKWLIKWYLVGC